VSLIKDGRGSDKVWKLPPNRLIVLSGNGFMKIARFLNPSKVRYPLPVMAACQAVAYRLDPGIKCMRLQTGGRVRGWIQPLNYKRMHCGVGGPWPQKDQTCGS
jgi:hypothetical protein